MAKVLVTGGTGFTGRALVKRLLGLGHQVVVMDYKPGVAKGFDTAKNWKRPARRSSSTLRA